MSDTGPSPRRFTKRTRVSWGSRLGDAFKGMLVGLVLAIAGIVLLVWNEGRAVQTARSLAEAGSAVVTVPADRIDTAMEGQLVHVAGELEVTEPLADPEFGISATAARLVRTVEMYQWEEERRTETRTATGGSEERITTYEYRPTWAEREIDSTRFERSQDHRNPAKPYNNRDVVADDARLGEFSVGRDVLNQLRASDEVPVERDAGDRLRAELDEPVTITAGRIMISEDPGNPQIGDVRIGYSIAPAGPISVVARQTGDSFAPYQTAAGDAILMAQAGILPSDVMIHAAERENMLFTWLLRGAGAAAIFFGFVMFLRPIGVLGDVIPLVGSILRTGTGIVAGLATLILAPLAIALAWFAYRPLVSIIVLAVGVAAAFGLRQWAARRASQSGEATQTSE